MQHVPLLFLFQDQLGELHTGKDKDSVQLPRKYLSGEKSLVKQGHPADNHLQPRERERERERERPMHHKNLNHTLLEQ